MSDLRTGMVVGKIERMKLPGYGADEVAFLSETVFKLEPDFVCEWGTNRGSSSRIFFEATKLIEVPPTIHTVELPQELAEVTADHPGIQTGMYIRRCRRIERHTGDGLTIGLQLYLEASPERALFFLDGDHSYENVWRELEALRIAAPHAVLVLHDTNHPASAGPTGPDKALNDFDWTGYRRTDLFSQAGMVRMWPV